MTDEDYLDIVAFTDGILDLEDVGDRGDVPGAIGGIEILIEGDGGFEPVVASVDVGHKFFVVGYSRFDINLLVEPYCLVAGSHEDG